MSGLIIKFSDKKFPLNKCLGRGYDDDNNTEGIYAGVQSLAAQNLNLVVNDKRGYRNANFIIYLYVTNLKEIWHSTKRFDNVQVLYLLINNDEESPTW